MQHAPVNSGQAWLAHSTEEPWNTPPPKEQFSSVALVHVALEGGGAPLFASLADMRAAAAWTVPLLLRLAAAGHADLAEAALLSVPCGGARALPAIDVFQRLWDSFGEGNAVEALWERDRQGTGVACIAPGLLPVAASGGWLDHSRRLSSPLPQCVSR